MPKRLLALSLVIISLACLKKPAQAHETAVIASAVTADGMVGEFFRPATAEGPVPAVLVLGGSEGGLAPDVTREARLIAQNGMAAFQLAYFGVGHLPQSLQLIRVEYFTRAIAWLQSQPGIDPERVAILGTSVGGEAALLIAAYDPAVHAVVAAVPSGIVWQGLAAWGQRNPASSFSWAGEPLPDLPHRAAQNGNTFDRYAVALDALARHRDVIIPIERIHGPVMLICGARDAVWPSCPMSEMAAAQLRAAHFAYPVTLLAFPKAGHAVFGPPLAASAPGLPALGSLGGTAAANNAARMVDWPAFFTFLDKAFDERPDNAKLGLESERASR
jgi:dienelactone hydrolase